MLGHPCISSMGNPTSGRSFCSFSQSSQEIEPRYTTMGCHATGPATPPAAVCKGCRAFPKTENWRLLKASLHRKMDYPRRFTPFHTLSHARHPAHPMSTRSNPNARSFYPPFLRNAATSLGWNTWPWSKYGSSEPPHRRDAHEWAPSSSSDTLYKYNSYTEYGAVKLDLTRAKKGSRKSRADVSQTPSLHVPQCSETHPDTRDRMSHGALVLFSGANYCTFWFNWSRCWWWSGYYMKTKRMRTWSIQLAILTCGTVGRYWGGQKVFTSRSGGNNKLNISPVSNMLRLQE